MIDQIITDVNILHQISKPVTMEQILELNLRDRLEAANMLAWTLGAGLAAIQIGIPLQFGWYRIDGNEFILVNPVILGRRGKHTTKEGCLSIPHKWIEVERAWEIEYKNGEKIQHAKGFKARLIQHEIDHMNGRLITDE